MLLRELGCIGQERAGRDNDTTIVGHLLNCRQQRSHRLWRTPGARRDVSDLMAGKIESGQRSRGVDQEGTRGLMVIVLGIEGGEENAGVEEQCRHEPGRVAFTWAAEPPP